MQLRSVLKMFFLWPLLETPSSMMSPITVFKAWFLPSISNENPMFSAALPQAVPTLLRLILSPMVDPSEPVCPNMPGWLWRSVAWSWAAKDKDSLIFKGWIAGCFNRNFLASIQADLPSLVRQLKQGLRGINRSLMKLSISCCTYLANFLGRVLASLTYFKVSCALGTDAWVQSNSTQRQRMKIMLPWLNIQSNKFYPILQYSAIQINIPVKLIMKENKIIYYCYCPVTVRGNQGHSNIDNLVRSHILSYSICDAIRLIQVDLHPIISMWSCASQLTTLQIRQNVLRWILFMLKLISLGFFGLPLPLLDFSCVIKISRISPITFFDSLVCMCSRQCLVCLLSAASSALLGVSLVLTRILVTSSFNDLLC